MQPFVRCVAIAVAVVLASEMGPSDDPVKFVDGSLAAWRAAAAPSRGSCLGSKTCHVSSVKLESSLAFGASGKSKPVVSLNLFDMLQTLFMTAVTRMILQRGDLERVRNNGRGAHLLSFSIHRLPKFAVTGCSNDWKI